MTDVEFSKTFKSYLFHANGSLIQVDQVTAYRYHLSLASWMKPVMDGEQNWDMSILVAYQGRKEYKPIFMFGVSTCPAVVRPNKSIIM